jgi:antitoxin component of RelBE/YafQ-DinJ toxin-antitoxin module
MYILESMKTAVINFKVEPKIKTAAQARARKLGIPLSAVLYRQLLSFAKGDKFNFEYPAEQMTPHMEKLIEESEASGTVGPFDSVKEARAYFEAHKYED